MPPASSGQTISPCVCSPKSAAGEIVPPAGGGISPRASRWSNSAPSASAAAMPAWL
jgi:hypothetical protein